jgi:hypothetical protein
MRFMVMHKLNAEIEAGVLNPRVMTEMGALMQEGMKSGLVQNGAGLKPGGTRLRMQFRGTECTVSERPSQGFHSLLAGFAMIKVKSKTEAMDWARRFAKVVGDMDLELGQVTEAWDLGLVPKPEGEVPLRFLMLMMADRNSEAGTPPSEREMAEMGKLIGEMRQAGVLLLTEGVRPSSLGSRLRFEGDQRASITDGPFAESKELISGFCLIQVPTKEAAVAWADRYGAILRDIEVDVLRLHDVAAFAG